MNKYSKFFGFVAAGAFALLLFTSATFASGGQDVSFSYGDQDFTLHNNTGKTIDEVYVAPSGQKEWGDDVLGEDDVLGSGQQVNIVFSRKNKVNNYDINVVFTDGKDATWTNFDLSTITDITIFFKNGKPWATWE